VTEAEQIIALRALAEQQAATIEGMRADFRAFTEHRRWCDADTEELGCGTCDIAAAITRPMPTRHIAVTAAKVDLDVALKALFWAVKDYPTPESGPENRPTWERHIADWTTKAKKTLATFAPVAGVEQALFDLLAACNEVQHTITALAALDGLCKRVVEEVGYDTVAFARSDNGGWAVTCEGQDSEGVFMDKRLAGAATPSAALALAVKPKRG